jgi:hypothetical protein
VRIFRRGSFSSGYFRHNVHPQANSDRRPT